MVRGIDIIPKLKQKFKNKTAYTVELKGQRNKKISWKNTQKGILSLADTIQKKNKKFSFSVNALLPTGDVSVIGHYAFNGENFEDAFKQYEEYLNAKVKDVHKFLEADLVSITFYIKKT